MNDNDKIPVALVEGVIKVGDVSLRVYKLSDGSTVIHEDDMHKFFDEFAGNIGDLSEAFEHVRSDEPEFQEPEEPEFEEPDFDPDFDLPDNEPPEEDDKHD